MSLIYTLLVLIFTIFIILVQIKDLRKEKGWKKHSLSILILLTCIYLLFRILPQGIKISFDTPFIAPFTWQHGQYVWLVLLNFTYIILHRDRIKREPDPFFKTYFFVSLFQIISLYSWYVLETRFDLAVALPLELSRITSILYLIYLKYPKEKIINIAFYFGLFAVGSFLLPTTINDLDHILGWSYFINHAITLTTPLLAYYAFGWRPQTQNIKKACRYFLFYIMVVVILNPLVEGNYFYLVDRPFLNDWPFLLYLLFVFIGTYIVFWAGYGLFEFFVKIEKTIER